MNRTEMKGIERKVLIIIIDGEQPKMTSLKTLSCGTDVINARVNGEKSLVKVEDLKNRYSQKYGDNGYKLFISKKTPEGTQVRRY